MTVRTLLSAPGSQSFINYQDAQGHTPLHYSTNFGHEAVSKRLIAACCNVDLQTKLGDTPLHLAAVIGHEAVTEQLIAARCNVDLQEVLALTCCAL